MNALVIAGRGKVGHVSAQRLVLAYEVGPQLATAPVVNEVAGIRHEVDRQFLFDGPQHLRFATAIRAMCAPRDSQILRPVQCRDCELQNRKRQPHENTRP
jgi:hypothetical protein